MLDAAKAARHPAIAEMLILEQQARIAELERQLAAALATQPQALEFSADAI